MIKASLGVGSLVLAPGLACGYDDEQVFAGALTELPPTATPHPTATPPPTTTPVPELESEPTSTPGLKPSPTATETEAAPVAPGQQAVLGEMVIAFTYTQSSGGKNEWPYVAVWLEDAAGELVHTVALWYQQGRKGSRWLDHLSRWYTAEAEASNANSSSTISSATRAPGSYAVVWDGGLNDGAAPAADYFVCIESAREEGPYSLIREAFRLEGSLPESPLADAGELSGASVRIDT